jgi:tetratricopeptide (TPR) repeat protein
MVPALQSPGLAVCVAMLLTVPANPCRADEQIIAFLEGLRERGYFDTAMEYLDSVGQRPDVPAEIRDVIDLQRGITLQKAGAASRVPEDRDQLLDQAQTALAKFLAEHAGHPQAADANSLLAQLKFDVATSLIWKADEEESPAARAGLQQQARVHIEAARSIFQTATDQYRRIFKDFPAYIDENKDEAQFQARLKAEADYVRAWFNLIRCTYERGQTFDRGSDERKSTLNTAAKQFEEIHAAFRTNQIGLQSRLMMGRCFQEQDDLGRALGIYNEMLDHKSDKAFVVRLKGTARHFRLMCFNDPQRKDYQLVIQEAGQWLQENRPLVNSEAGLGIQWERARAEEQLAATRELTEEEKEGLLRAALNDATTVSKFAGPYREAALSMVRRLKLALGDKDKEPRDFETAFERARGLIGQIETLSEALDAAPASERSIKQAALDSHLAEIGRLLRLALDLSSADSDRKAVAQSRYLLSFVLLRQEKPYDAAILASHVMVHDRDDDPDTALNATEVAMIAAVAAWNRAPARERDFETRTLRDICQKILDLYPQSARGGEARMRLGMAYRTMNQPLEAATWFLQVPESDPQYASARINAGQSYWAAWTQKAALAGADESTASPPAEMQTWKQEARSLLTQGIQLTREKLGSGAPPGEELGKAEVSLASIQIQDGEFAEAVERLTAGGDNSVLAAVGIAGGATRPDDGLQSASFAGLTYRLLLRAYVGLQQIDKAQETMTLLENVGGQDIIGAYTQLGIELQDELKRLTVSGDTARLQETRESFEKFLARVYEARDKSDYRSLLWIGETYYGLGQGLAGDAAGAAAYYSKAADAYSEILTNNLAAAEGVNAVQLRLARCRRAQGRFAEALKMISAILSKNPNILDAQFEAAYTLSDWGEAGEPPRLLESIKGPASDRNIWGWSKLSRQLQQIVAKSPTPDFTQRFVDARYEMGNSRRRYARVSTADAESQLKAGQAEIVSLVQVFRDLDDASFARFDRLYQDMQSDLGQSAIPLERASAAVPAEPPAVADHEGPASKKADVAAAPIAAASKEGGSNWLLPVIATSLFAGLAAAVVVLIRKPKHRPKIPGSSTAPKFTAVSAAMSDAAGSAFPAGLDVAAPAAPDFSAFGGIAAPPRRAARPAVAGPAAESAARPKPAATSGSSAPRPGAPTKPSTGAPRPAVTGAAPASGAPAQRPVQPRPVPPKPSSPAGEAAPGAAPRPPVPGPRQKPPEPGP